MVLSGILISCIEDNKINGLKYSNNELQSLETSTGVTLNFSDLGKSKVLLKAPKLIKLMADQDQLIMECPEGLELIFYDSLMKVESVLVADYGKLFSNEQQLFVRDNVVFNNQNLDTLFAEELEIDFAKDSVYSEKLVTFSNSEGRITGNKLIANSNFTFFKLSDISQSHVNYNLELNSTADFLHFNSIDFNPQLNQILLSVRNFNEIWIIDHNTSSLQAKSHKGGKCGKGGDLIYRWGNAKASNLSLIHI